MGAGGAPARIIDEPYLLALPIRLVRDGAGRFFADPAWAKDLLLHTEYLTQLTLVCPFVADDPPPGWREVKAPGLRIHAYRSTERGIGQYLALAGLATRLLIEVPRTRIVHAAVAGYPLPPGWLAIPLARLFGKAVAIPVESAFWRLPLGSGAGRGARVKAAVWERINRFCLRQADYAVYSQDAYRRSLPSPRAGGGDLFQASWIDEEVVLPVGVIADRAAVRSEGRARFLFAARMIPEKGTGVLANALALLGARDADLDVDIIGEGPELSRFRTIAATTWGRRHMRVLDPVPYGPVFFALLGGYDAVLVPSLSDEQPRIVYDAGSQGVPVIAADTPGTRACIRDGETGTLVAPNDPAALAGALIAAAADRAGLGAQGLAGRELAAQHTHRGMHRQRATALQAMLARMKP